MYMFMFLYHIVYKDILHIFNINCILFMLYVKVYMFYQIEYKKILFWKNEMQVKYADRAVIHKFDMFCGSKKAL